MRERERERVCVCVCVGVCMCMCVDTNYTSVISTIIIIGTIEEESKSIS